MIPINPRVGHTRLGSDGAKAGRSPHETHNHGPCLRRGPSSIGGGIHQAPSPAWPDPLRPGAYRFRDHKRRATFIISNR